MEVRIVGAPSAGNDNVRLTASRGVPNCSGLSTQWKFSAVHGYSPRLSRRCSPRRLRGLPATCLLPHQTFKKSICPGRFTGRVRAIRNRSPHDSASFIFSIRKARRDDCGAPPVAWRAPARADPTDSGSYGLTRSVASHSRPRPQIATECLYLSDPLAVGNTGLARRAMPHRHGRLSLIVNRK